jgi:PAS domain S-box-containing protein
VIEGVVLSFTEVTAFKMASDAVQRSETMLATAQELAHLGCWELDVSTGACAWSGEMFRIFGYPPATTPMSLDDILNTLAPDDQEQVKLAIRNSVESLAPYDLQHGVTRPDGSRCVVRSRAMPIAHANGQVTRLIGTTLDIGQ